MVFCSACMCHHHKNEFGPQQLRKSAKVRICRNAKKTLQFSSIKYSQYADALEFGRFREFYTERMEQQWADMDD